MNHNQPGIPPRSRVRNVIMDRTPRAIDREVALGMVLEMGYSQGLFLRQEADSCGRTPDGALGFVHVPDTAQDHYWKLCCANEVWYFQYTDYSPPVS